MTGNRSTLNELTPLLSSIQRHRNKYDDHDDEEKREKFGDNDRVEEVRIKRGMTVHGLTTDESVTTGHHSSDELFSEESKKRSPAHISSQVERCGSVSPQSLMRGDNDSKQYNYYTVSARQSVLDNKSKVSKNRHQDVEDHVAFVQQRNLHAHNILKDNTRRVKRNRNTTFNRNVSLSRDIEHSSKENEGFIDQSINTHDENVDYRDKKRLLPTTPTEVDRPVSNVLPQNSEYQWGERNLYWYQNQGLTVTGEAIEDHNPEDNRFSYFGNILSGPIRTPSAASNPMSTGDDEIVYNTAKLIRQMENGCVERYENRKATAIASGQDWDSDVELDKEEQILIEVPNFPSYILDNHHDHVLPINLYRIHNPFVSPPPESESGNGRGCDGTSSFFVTVGCIWNTMMGTSLLTMPWGFQKAGLVGGPLIMLTLTFICCLTAWAIVSLWNQVATKTGRIFNEFAPVCGYVNGKTCQFVVLFLAFGAISGASTAYWVLISGFVKNTLDFIYYHIVMHVPFRSHDVKPDEISDHESYFNTSQVHVVGDLQGAVLVASNTDQSHNMSNNFSTLHLDQNLLKKITLHTLICDKPHTPELHSSSNPSLDESWENITSTSAIPFYMFCVFVPLLSVTTTRLVKRLNAIGTLMVVVLLSFVIHQGFVWGWNFDIVDSTSRTYVPLISVDCHYLAGALSLGLFIHNAIVSIMRGHDNQSKNGAAIVTAYTLVCITYMTVGLVFYLTFPMAKDCISDNFLNNFPLDSWSMFAIRLAILIQLLTVFPIIAYIWRNSFANVFDMSAYQSGDESHEPLHYKVTLNFLCGLMSMGVAIFIPKIGEIISWTGAVCGLGLVFILPALSYTTWMVKHVKKINYPLLVVFIIGVLIGSASFVAQIYSSLFLSNKVNLPHVHANHVNDDHLTNLNLSSKNVLHTISP